MSGPFQRNVRCALCADNGVRVDIDGHYYRCECGQRVRAHAHKRSLKKSDALRARMQDVKAGKW